MFCGAILGEGFFLFMFWADEDLEALVEAGNAGREHLSYSVWNWDNMIFGLPWVVAGLTLGAVAWAVTRTVVTLVLNEGSVADSYTKRTTVPRG